MAKIHLLDDLTANQIAAGEVIERPVSVVKELVENALDAGAANILVELQDGGLKSIVVKDDGCGMSKEDSLLALRRHATSKLNVIADLEKLTSLGFRGEALPSITAVSKTVLVTREAGSDFGNRIELEGSQIISVEPTGAPLGTMVSVSDLFFNTPARKKFMRSPAYEAGLIHELMIHFSLGHPQTAFQLLSEGKEVLNTKGIKTVPELVQLFYGRKAREALLEFRSTVSMGEMKGYMTVPSYHRVNRKAIHFIVNLRRVFSKELMKSLEEAYEQTLPKGRFPLAVIDLQLEPSFIDVNVHPSKLEIRFRELSVVREFLESLRGCLAKASLTTVCPVSITLPQTIKEDTEHLNGSSSPYEEQKASLGSQEVFQDFYTWKIVDSAPLRINENDKDKLPEYPPRSPDCLPALRVIGQLDNTFILFEGEKGLYLIDQHAAHERVLYEQLLKQSAAGTVGSQLLLQPVTLHLTALEEEAVIEHILPLADLGIVLEHFGAHTYLLRAVPAVVQEDPQELFFQLLEKLTGRTHQICPADLRQEFLVMASCKGAIKAGQKLSPQEILQLLADLNATRNPLTCPHGRPVLHHISYQEIYKAFKRPLKG